jgi:hypothetical protein
MEKLFTGGIFIDSSRGLVVLHHLSDCRSARRGMNRLTVAALDRRAGYPVHSLHSTPGKNKIIKEIITEEPDVTCVEVRLATYHRCDLELDWRLPVAIHD